MIFSYASQALIAILSKYGKKGLTTKEILETDKREYHAFSKTNLSSLDPYRSSSTEPFVEIRDGRWFLKQNPEVKYMLEGIVSEADKQARALLADSAARC